MITIDTISKKYGKAEVLNVEKIDIPTGQSFGLVGNNGAGKTTLFNILLDLIRPTTGKISNHNIVVNESEEWKNFTGSFIDESFLITYLTPEEYFDFIGDLRGMNKADVAKFLSKFDEFFNGEIVGKKKYLRDLSKGNQKKAGIVAALMGNPQVVILDEPFANLDPTTQIRLKKIIKELTENREITVLVSSHDLTHVTEVCERIVVLDKGAVVKDIETSEATLKELESYFAL
ncbi:ABC transporter ATP-binding protein [Polaribacter haliotis]|uniref:ABC transporter ATP-binding protein n=1 Tax=Polaribacter haliotis TaxID=1888915 RepID=A0A7L8AD28_9FLAO|nr:ABC transporter ATP-binding protein [Polaribacter haliotis]QOD59905.1 ABC transporter ATP-binding protein [Polaribacter haliotis]